MRDKLKKILLDLVSDRGVDNHIMEKTIDNVIELFKSEAKNIYSNELLLGYDKVEFLLEKFIYSMDSAIKELKRTLS